MRHLLATSLSLALLIAAPTLAEAKLKVFACFPEWEALVKHIGGEKVEVVTAISALKNPGHVTVTPETIAAIASADLLVCTGAGFEDKWLPSALRRANNPKLAEGRPGRFFARDFVEGLGGSLASKGDGHTDHTHSVAKADGDPYVQGDPYRIRTLSGQLARRMIDIDPNGAATYTKNAKAFIRELGKLTKSLEAKAAPLRGINIIAQHNHSVYLLKWLKIETAAIVEPKAGVPPGPAELARVIATVPTSGSRLAIHAAYEDPRPSKYVTDRADIPLINMPFTVGGTPDASDFLEFYSASVERLLDGLAGRDRP